MDEYISREATVKAFCEKCKGYYDGHCVHRGECDIDVIQTAPSVDIQPVNQWISVNDRLPDVAEAEVLVWIDDGTADGIKIYNSLHIAYWYGDTKLFYDFHCDEIKGVTHWMYVSAIPEPTKDGDS